jgi:hypothetical protein
MLLGSRKRVLSEGIYQFNLVIKLVESAILDFKVDFVINWAYAHNKIKGQPTHEQKV